MNPRTRHYFLLFLKVYIVVLLFSPLIQSAFSISEIMDLYQSPQGLGMGDALTADATGYQSIFYNPAGVSNQFKKNWEINPFDFEGGFSGDTVGAIWKTQNLNPYRLMNQLSSNSSAYYHESGASVPSFTMRNFSLALFGLQHFAGQNTGSNLDVLVREDIGLAFALGTSLAGNLFKIGITGKGLIRNELRNLISYSDFSLTPESSFGSLFKEGWGVGADLGIIVSLPEKFLPTIGIVWKDMFGTYFHHAHVLNSQASGTPDPIDQSVNAAFSVHPVFSPWLKSTLSLEYKHIELGALPLRDHLHLGFQLESSKEFFLWLGAYQLYPTGGLGYRMKGGNFEWVTYATDIANGGSAASNRRFVFRYSLSY
jgi:hypothetical protein